MKNIVYLSIILSIGLISCKKDETTQTTSRSSASTDLGTQMSGLYLGSGVVNHYGDNLQHTLTKVQVTRLSASKVTVSSPEGFFDTYESGTILEITAGSHLSDAFTSLLNGNNLTITKLPDTSNNNNISFSGTK